MHCSYQLRYDIGVGKWRYSAPEGRQVFYAFAADGLLQQRVGIEYAFGLLVIGLLDFLAVSEMTRELISYVNLIQHMDDFARGIVDTRRLVYYLSVAVFFLILSSRTLALNKWR